MMKVTEHFTMEELTDSDYATRHVIDNSPGQQALQNLLKMANSLQDIRDLIAAPLIITSGYRSPELNERIGGSRTSAHMKGFAADIRSHAFGTPYQLASAIINSPIKFDQLILEFDRWVHFGLAQGKWRNQILTAMKVEGETVYHNGLVQ